MSQHTGLPAAQGSQEPMVSHVRGDTRPGSCATANTPSRGGSSGPSLLHVPVWGRNQSLSSGGRVTSDGEGVAASTGACAGFTACGVCVVPSGPSQAPGVGMAPTSVPMGRTRAFACVARALSVCMSKAVYPLPFWDTSVPPPPH